MRFLVLGEVLELHRHIIQEYGGLQGVRDIGALISALTQPRMTFSGAELYPTLEAKAAAFCFFIVQNHPFLDGNKRCGHAVMETFLILNGCEIKASTDEMEQVILSLASGESSLEKLTEWLRDHLVNV
jgi:death-on-curing protein